MGVLKRIVFPVAVFVFLFSGAVSAFSLNVYLKGADTPLPANYVSALAVAPNGTLWIGTGGGGLASLNAEGKWEMADKKNGFTAREISSIVIDNDQVLVGTEEGLFTRNKDGQWTSVLEAADGKLIKPVLVLADRELWAGALGPKGGLFRRNTAGVWERVSGPKGESMNDVLDLEVVEKTIWIGTMNHGIYRYEKGTWKHHDMKSGLPHFYVGDLSWDGESMWAAIPKTGLVKITGDQIEVITGDDGLPLEAWQKILYDSEEEDLWIGTAKSGLVRYDGRRWTPYGKEDGLLGLRIYALAKGPKGIWVGTNIGLVSLTP